MKNKTFTFILLGIVGFVWFKVFVRIGSNFAQDPTPLPESNRQINIKKIVEPKDFALHADYRDPFSGRLIESVESNSVPAPSSIQDPESQMRTTKVSVPIYWPSIRYHGFVRNINSTGQRILLSIDGTIFKLKVQDRVLDDIQVISANREEVKLRYKGEVRSFGK